MPFTKLEYLHDATVCDIALHIFESGERQLRIRLQCDSDCGYFEWNEKRIDVVFHDPLLILGELFGHMSNAESFDTWHEVASQAMSGHILRLTEAGIWAPECVVQLVFHSGSRLEIACKEIEFVTMKT